MKKIILVFVYLITFNSTMAFSMEKNTVILKNFIVGRIKKEIISKILKNFNLDFEIKEVLNIFTIIGKQSKSLVDSNENSLPYMQMKIINTYKNNNFINLKNSNILNVTKY